MQKYFAFRCSPSILAAALAAVIPFSASYADDAHHHGDDYQAILQSSENNFKEHRSNPQTFNQYTIWNTDISLSGQECQIWQWGGDNYSLICSRTFPEREAGTDFFKGMQYKLQTNLGSDVKVTDRSAYLAERGMYTHIASKDNKRKIDMFLLGSSNRGNNGLFQDARTFHIVVSGAHGMPVRILQTALKSSD